MTPKTVICLWTQEECLIFVVEGDYKHLEGVAINTIAVDDYTAKDLDEPSNREYVEKNPSNTKKNQDELLKVVCDDKHGWIDSRINSEQVSFYLRHGATFIQAVFVV